MSLALRIPARAADGASPAVEPVELAVRLDLPAGEPRPFAFLYLHGFASDQGGEKASFFRQRARDAGWPFCSLDFQGHGESGGDLLGLSLGRNLADVAAVHALLAARGYPRVVVIGSSMGGLTGLWHAALHPERVAAGLHIAPAVALAEGFLAHAGPEGARQWEERGVYRFADDRGACDIGWGLITDLRQRSFERLLEIHRTPSLLLQGQRDTQVPWRRVAELAAAAQGPVELHLFSDGDHRLTDRKPELWALMQGFLGRRGLMDDGTLAAGIGPAATS